MADTLVEKLHFPWQGSGDNYTIRATRGPKSVGSASKPIYLDTDGIFTAVTHTLGADVPSDAVFTDTKNTAGSTNDTSKLFIVGAKTQDANPQTYSNSKAYVNNGNIVSESSLVVANSGNTVRCNIAYDTTEDALKFTFE